MPIKNNKTIVSKLLFPAFVCTFLMISCGSPLQPGGENRGIIITHKINSKLDVEKYKKILLAGFISSSENSFDIKDIAYENYKRELSKNSTFLIIFEKPLEIGKTFIKSEAKNLDFTTDNIFEDYDLWKKVADIYKVDLLIAGDISFTNEIRTSIEKKVIYQNEQESTISKILELKFFTLSVTFYFFDGMSGKLLEVKKISKEKSYGKSEEESKNIFLNLIRETIPEIRSILISEREPIRRILLK
jgi:hypothetical protein